MTAVSPRTPERSRKYQEVTALDHLEQDWDNKRPGIRPNVFTVAAPKVKQDLAKLLDSLESRASSGCAAAV